MNEEFYEQALKSSVIFSFIREFDEDLEDLHTVIYTLCDVELIDEDSCEIDSEDPISIDNLKKWMKKEIEQGFTCYNLEYHGDDDNYNIIATLPQLVDVANILGILDEFECSQVDIDDIYLTTSDEDDEEGEE
jgi:hypothetical protein